MQEKEKEEGVDVKGKQEEQLLKEGLHRVEKAGGVEEGTWEGPVVDGGGKDPATEVSVAVISGATGDDGVPSGGSLAGGSGDAAADAASASVPPPMPREDREGTVGGVAEASTTAAVAAVEVEMGQDHGGGDDDAGGEGVEEPQVESRRHREENEARGDDSTGAVCPGAGSVGVVCKEGDGERGGGGGVGGGALEGEGSRAGPVSGEESVAAAESAESRGAGDQVRVLKG